jgi:hypothetical protein
LESRGNRGRGSWLLPVRRLAKPRDQSSGRHTFGGKAGLIISGTNKSSNEPLCTGIIPLANGTAAIAITNGRFGIDTCSVVKHVGEVIAGKTP